jgi:hypothetical protein
MRALQEVPPGRAPEVEAMPEFQRLLAVTSSPIFGLAMRENLLPTGRDPLSAALHITKMSAWSVPLLTAEAARVARATDDISLVGLAARVEDPVVLTALRESVVLYAEMVVGCALMPRLEFVWQVDPSLAAAARRFVDAFNGLFGPELPPPTAEYASIYWSASTESEVEGRCVRLGQSDPPDTRYYHWAIRRAAKNHLVVHEFWSQEIMTTASFRQGDRRMPPNPSKPRCS